ncbi:DNA (cytosine-5)-methyltransferase 1 [Gammaproteobacteria bacterium]
MNELSLFAGAGGGILGGVLLGWRTVCAVEIDPYARRVLLARQADGCLSPFPVWDDVCTFDGTEWRDCVDVISGGFPCQDISVAGKGAGITGERSGLWKEFARIIGEVRPRYVFVENSPALLVRGIDVVAGDLAALGYDAQWEIVSAADAGAPHIRKRIWILAYAQGKQNDRRECGNVGEEEECRKSFDTAFESGREDVADADLSEKTRQRQRIGKILSDEKTIRSCEGSENASDTNPEGLQERQRGKAKNRTCSTIDRCDWWNAEPDVGRVAHGVAFRVDRLRCLGNGQVPAVAALAWRLLNNNEE